MTKNVQMFDKKGYCIVKNAISEELRDFVTQYTLFDEMQNYTNEVEMFGADVAQVPAAHSKYADPAMETMLLHLHTLMETNTGLKLFPTYSYYRVYRNGDELKPHQDRPSCEISCTMCLNYSYDSKKYQWPIFMNGEKVILNPGDLVIYRGCDLSHWRNEFDIQEDSWHVQGFFHYVDQDGPHAESKYDGRKTIGEKKKFKKEKSFTNTKDYITFL